jgi:hypothetical protein
VNGMENLFIGIAASFVIFLLFFLVFLLRGQNNGETGRLHGCGQPKGQCHCSRHDTKRSHQGFNLHSSHDVWPITPEAPCPRDASVKKSTNSRRQPS